MIAQIDQREPVASTCCTVGNDTRICPPLPAAAILAARWTSSPTYPSAVRTAVPVWIPTRTRMGPGPQGDVTVSGRLERASGEREREEEGIPLRVDLDPAVTSERLPEHPAVLGQHVGVGALTQPCSSRVDPSTSVNRNVTGPSGRSARMIEP